MVSPRDAMKAVARGIAQSDELPSDMSLLLHEADMDSSDADVDLPMLEIQPQVDHIVTNNTDLAGYITDDNDNQVGRIYHSEYELQLQLDIWTTADGGYDPDRLGERLREALYPYSSYGPDQNFVDDRGDIIDEITYFTFDDGERTDDLIRTPTVRRWSQTAELWASEEFRTTEDYIVDVHHPRNGSLSGQGDGEING